MSRPSSSRPRPSSAKTAPVKVSGEDLTYEDLLVAQYLDELRKSPRFNKSPVANTPQSPYLQRLSHTHIVPLNRRRPQSALAPGSKPQIDPKYIDDPEVWDPASPRGDEGVRRRMRPGSAPVYKRPLSAAYSSVSSRATSTRSFTRRARPLYKRQPHTIVTTVFKNGTRDVFARVAAPNIKTLLEHSTEKLQMGSAARRVFLEDGTEVFTPKDIPRDADVYVSSGEPFKNPYKGVKKNQDITQSLQWTMNGLVWPQDAKKRKTKPQLSKRFRSLISQSRRRVLVFRNGHGTQSMEIVADPERFEDFLVACTAKLDLGSYARVLYDWEGQEVKNLEDAPVLDQCLQTWSTPVLGPLWVSRGEGFSPKGVSQFLDGLMTYTRAKLKEAKNYRQQLQCAQSEDTREQVEIVAILSMADQEIQETLDIVAKDIEDFSNALNRLKEQNQKIDDMLQNEQCEGNDYTLKHIEKLDANHRIVGTKGIRLKVYENGTLEGETSVYFNLQQAARGISNDKETLMARLLDVCSASSGLANPKNNPAIHPIAKKLYNDQGDEVKNVYDLESDQMVWLSFGEAWKNPYTYVVMTQYDRARVYEDSNGAQIVHRETLMSEDIKNREKSSRWEMIQGVPQDISAENMSPELQQESETRAIRNAHTAYYLKSKDDPSLLIMPAVVVDTKKTKGSAEVWPPEGQLWLITKDGYIRSKAFPSMVLAVTELRVATHLGHPSLGHTDLHVEGYLVSVQKKGSTGAQTWGFSADGHIYNHSQPELVLTFLGAQYGNEDSNVFNEVEESNQQFSGSGLYLAVCEKMEKESKAQRWALKQERFDNLGQWKHCTVENPEWNKRALSWPVNDKGEMNDAFDWPMEGLLLPYAPSTRKPKDKKGLGAMVPLRLLCLKNGTREISKATAVVGPDLTNMRKDTHKDKGKKSRKKSGRPMKDTESIDVDQALHCEDDLTVLKLEMMLFLERCTSMLDLPFAARRVYDESGTEHFSLRGLARDQLVYVSCGEPWSDPNLSKAEQQRRFLLANLSSDVGQMRQYVALREPNNLVMAVEAGLFPGSRVLVSECALVPEVEADEQSDLPPVVTSEPVDDQTAEALEREMTSHEVAHIRAEERLNKLKWPWERIANQDLDQGEDAGQQGFSNQQLYDKFSRTKPQHQTDSAALHLQKFLVEDGYIVAANSRDLVLGVTDAEARVAEVVLVKKKPDDIHQRWILHDNGLIQAKHNPQLVLTVSMPAGDASALTYIGCGVSLQQKRTQQSGRANQRWYYDQATGFIGAFHTDTMDKEITAANKANVCTYAVMGDTNLDQPGYMVEMSGGKGAKSRQLMVCVACARAMRGRHKMEKVSANVDFACSMGNAKELGVRQVGSFQCLNGKVDLSTHEAEHTLEVWETQLDRLKEELSVRTIAKEISAARVPYTVRVLAYKNGEGRMKPGEVIVGSSVAGLLEQATQRLGLPQAARRLYTQDGTLTLDMDDLVDWVREEYVREARQQMRAAARAKRGGGSTDTAAGRDDKLMDKVDLDDSELDSEADDEEEEPVPEPEPEFCLGHYGVEPRLMDPAMARTRNMIVIPNPTEGMEQDGAITQWRLMARQEGTVILQVFRTSEESLNHYQLVGQITYTATQGENTVDISDTPMSVERGDIIGFQIKDTPMIPYDLDKSVKEAPFIAIPKAIPDVGDTIKMSSAASADMRKYALSAYVRPVAPTPPPPRPKKKKAKQPKQKKRPGPHIEPPPVDMVLRYPIEVWVSSGETFIKPKDVERHAEQTQQQREERAAVAYELDKEKHVLRHMQGRRYDDQNPGNYRSTRNPTHPVLVEGHWQEPTLDELQKHDSVHQLETHLTELRVSQSRGRPAKACNASTTRRLYSQPNMKRVLVFPNGESIERAVYVWGETLPQLVDNATSRLNLRKPGKTLFNMEGTLIQSLSEVERDQLVCVGADRRFQRPKENHQAVEVKANWGRARRQYGPHATDIVVTTRQNPDIDVDPFGPSTLAAGKKSRSREQPPSPVDSDV